MEVIDLSASCVLCTTDLHWYEWTMHHLAGRALTSVWCVYSFTIVVYENLFFNFTLDRKF